MYLMHTACLQSLLNHTPLLTITSPLTGYWSNAVIIWWSLKKCCCAVVTAVQGHASLCLSISSLIFGSHFFSLFGYCHQVKSVLPWSRILPSHSLLPAHGIVCIWGLEEEAFVCCFLQLVALACQTRSEDCLAKQAQIATADMIGDGYWVKRLGRGNIFALD